MIGTNINIGANKTDGIDFTLNYNQPIQDWGSLGVNVGRHVPQQLRDHADSGWRLVRLRRPVRSDLRHAAAGVALEAARNLEYAVEREPRVDVALFQLGGHRHQQQPALLKGAVDPANAQHGVAELHRPGRGVEHRQELDAVCRLRTTSSTRTRRSSAPRSPGPPFGNGNTYPQVYDALGRNLFLSITGKY